MGKKRNDAESDARGYKERLREAWIDLVQLQKHLIADELTVLAIFEGRDAAGKDGAIKRIVEHLSPRETRVVALGKPTDRDRASWYFARWVAELPVRGELALFNRSWYNRAGVERVFGFCTPAECQRFLEEVGEFERLLVRSGTQIVKVYLDIDREEQRQRLEDRRDDPLAQWKISPIDQKALEKFDDYTAARDEMLARTHTAHAPWVVVRAGNKKRARLAVMHHLLHAVRCDGWRASVAPPDADLLRPYAPELSSNGFLAR